MTAPFFSVIVPTLNVEATIGDCLSSVLAQTFEDFEIVVVDGLSSDRTRQIVAGHAAHDPRVRWHSGRDRGIYDAMNRGMKLARGRWLYFIGSDDTLAAREVLARVAARADDQRVVYGNVVVEGDASWAPDGAVYDGRFSLRKLLQKNICHQAMFYRRDFIERDVGDYEVEFRTCADWDFNLRCRSKTRFRYLDLTVARFRAGGQSTASAHDPKHSDGYIERALGYFGMSPFHPVSIAAFHRRKRELARCWWRRLGGKDAAAAGRR